MIKLEDFNSLKKEQKDIVLMILTSSAFNYINIYFVARHFIVESDWFVPFLFAICFSITQSFLSLLSSFYLNNKFFCYLSTSSFLLIILFKNIFISSIVALYFYFNEHSLLYFFITTMVIYALINIVFLVVYITNDSSDIKSTLPNNEKQDEKTNRTIKT